MNELTKEKTMTTRELAQALKVSVDTITRTATKILDPSAVQRRDINGGQSMVFNEMQATLIKQEIAKHHNLSTREIDTVSTEIEENEIIANAIAILNKRAIEYRNRAEKAEKQLIEQKPKVEFFDAVSESADCIDISECAKILNIKGIGRNKLFEILREKKILRENNQPYQKYVDCGFFRIIETSFILSDGTQKINLKTVVFQKGLDFIRKVLRNYDK